MKVKRIEVIYHPAGSVIDPLNQDALTWPTQPSLGVKVTIEREGAEERLRAGARFTPDLEQHGAFTFLADENPHGLLRILADLATQVAPLDRTTLIAEGLVLEVIDRVRDD